MVEDLEDVLRKGFSVWRRHPSIALPFLFRLIASTLLIIVFIVLALLPVLASFTSGSQGMMEAVWAYLGSGTIASILMVLLIFIFFVFAEMLIRSFFSAGAIGMAKEAIEASEASSGRVVTSSSLSRMMYYGKRKFIDLFLAQLIISASILLIILFFLITPILITAAAYKIFGMYWGGFFELGIALLGFLIVAITLLFVATPYAVVIGDLGAVGGLRRGYRFFMDNKLHVILFWFFIKYVSEFVGYAVLFIALFAFSAGMLFVDIPANVLSFLGYQPYDIMNLLMQLSLVFMASIGVAVLASLAISIFVVLPLTTVWWSMLYMDRSGGK